MQAPTQNLMARALRNGGGRSLAVMAIMAAVGTVGAGCHLLDINNPDIVPPVSLDDPLALATIRAGAIGDFGVAYTGSGAQGSGGTTEGQVLASGLLADEWINTETFPDRRSEERRVGKECRAGWSPDALKERD